MEIELKFILTDPLKAAIRLEYLGFKEGKLRHQIDNYLICNYPTYLRVRTDLLSNQSSLDYHEVISNMMTKETEVLVSDASKTIEIFKELGYEITCVIDKKRRTFINGPITVTIDEVKNLGYFLEIEVLELNENTLLEIKELAGSLGVCVDSCLIESKGYPELMQNITSANF